MANAPVFPGTLKNPVVSFTTADGTNFKDVYSPGVSGGKVESISIAQDSTAVRVVQFAINSSAGTDYIIGEVSIPASAGTDGSTKAVNALNSTDLPWIRNDGVNPYLLVAANNKLRAKVKTAMDAGKTLYGVGQAGDL